MFVIPNVAEADRQVNAALIIFRLDLQTFASLLFELPLFETGFCLAMAGGRSRQHHRPADFRSRLTGIQGKAQSPGSGADCGGDRNVRQRTREAVAGATSVKSRCRGGLEKYTGEKPGENLEQAMAVFKQDQASFRPGSAKGFEETSQRPVQGSVAPAAPSRMAPDPRQVAPMLAGAWARGLADMLEMLGQGAILIDASGAVLFVSERARGLLKGQFDLISQHIVGREGKANQALDSMIAQALSGVPGELRLTPDDSCRESRSESCSESPLTIRAYAAPAVQDPQVQLLKVVLAVS